MEYSLKFPTPIKFQNYAAGCLKHVACLFRL